MSIAINQNFNTANTHSQPKRGYAGSNSAENEKKLKLASGVGATIGVAAALAIVSKRHGINLFKNNKMPNLMKPSTWKIGNIEYKPGEIIGLAGGSVAGGLAAGLALDPEHKKAKLRESLQQMVGNIIIPVYTVTAASNFYNKHKDKIKLPTIKSNSNTAKKANKIIEAIPKAGIPLAALAVSAVVGNWVANFMSQQIFNTHTHRKIKISDFAGHVDDVCLAAMLVSPDNQIGKIAARIIPAALVVPGYQAGIKQTY